jgi:hypothetical protein
MDSAYKGLHPHISRNDGSLRVEYLLLKGSNACRAINCH